MRFGPMLGILACLALTDGRKGETMGRSEAHATERTHHAKEAAPASRWGLFLPIVLLVMLACILPGGGAARAQDQGAAESSPASAASAEALLFLSTQFAPVSEADAMRRHVLATVDVPVNFQPYNSLTVLSRLMTGEMGRVPGLVCGVHGDLMELNAAGSLADLDAYARDPAREATAQMIPPRFLELGHLGGAKPIYRPFTQATYLMMAHRQALDYLPQGADLQRLTYEELIAWAAKMHGETGEARLGFPAGPSGLIHRFIQGYLYPSFTGTTVGGFRSAEAREMWETMFRLWQHVSMRSLSFNNMDAPLLSEEVWVAWDHTARLMPAVKERPEDFVAFPAPAGPAGRGFMVVLTGLAVPSSAPDPARAHAVIDYLLRPENQRKVLTEIGFFPVVELGEEAGLPPWLKGLYEAIARQARAEDAVPAMLPPGLGGGAGGNLNSLYKSAFTRTILRGRPVAETLEQLGTQLQSLLDQSGARCWPPDAPSEGVCQVK